LETSLKGLPQEGQKFGAFKANSTLPPQFMQNSVFIHYILH